MPEEEKERTGLLDAAGAREAVEMALPSIEHVLKRPMVSGERVLHFVILDPLVKYGARPLMTRSCMNTVSEIQPGRPTIVLLPGGRQNLRGRWDATRT